MEEQESVWLKSISFKEQRQILKRLMRYALPFKRLFLAAIFFAFALAGMNVLLPKILQIFMDDYLTPLKGTTQVLLFFAGLYMVGVLVKAVVWFGQWVFYSKGALNTYQHIRKELYQKIHTLGMRYFDQTPAGSIVSRVMNDTETLFDFWTVFLMVLTGVLAVVFSLLAMFGISVKVTLFILIFLPILLVAIVYYQRVSSRIYRQMREKLSQLNTKLNESISGMNIIQQFRQEQRMINEFEATNESYLKSRYSVVRANALLLGPIINLLYALAVALVLSLFGIHALDHPVEAGIIYVFLSYVQAFFNPMGQMMDFLSVYTDGIVAGSRILKIMDQEEYNPQQNSDAHSQITQGKIEFRNVSFSYDGEQQILKNISFVAKPGETVALVGHTGSGKSSIINVMMRFYEFYEGEILIDDVDIRNYPMEELRQKMGLVLQDPFMFYGDISSNIRLLNQEISEEEIEAAAKFVGADDFIEKLPKKYHAKVIERGASYSSGQRQLLSFARTMVTHPKILVLDEATANIDTETEGLIQTSLRKMRTGRTTIAIAHRLSTIRDANLIMVLDKGEIKERGSHEELLTLEGRYYDLYRMQNGGES